ncbi:aminodeoxychorismate synthase component I [Mesorhizobium sp. CAU 1732]|uniref:aminodeoxychorismate synthase component I n=1 Tax=Mesorhizobium sp. CAU 1732 TaxID=3140358 RepID=UPI0032606F34
MATRPKRAYFRNDLNGQETLFSDPGAMIVAWAAEDFLPALDRVEQARADGKWLAGYISYEAGYLLDPALKALLPTNRRAPLLCFGVFDGPADTSTLDRDRANEQTNSFLVEPRATWGPDHYAEKFERLHRHLREGDCYQGNLTFPVEARWGGDPFAVFNALRQRQPVRYASFIDLDGPIVVSRSPELFFQVARDRWIETLPMKGTAPRGKTPQEDEALKTFLGNDPKNQAENRMIVDLLRNDISRISEVGTLDVPELFRVESYPTVHQMVSRVRARLIEGLTFRDILAGLFPCGSITGAPKISVMKILRALEDKPRDVYCGAIGWIAPTGEMRFSVAIRTISLFPDGEAVYNIGGGVVFDSTAEGEYEECLLKGRFATGEAPAFT